MSTIVINTQDHYVALYGHSGRPVLSVRLGEDGMVMGSRSESIELTREQLRTLRDAATRLLARTR